MFFTKILAFLATLALTVATPATAQQLTLAQIEQAWGGVKSETVRFSQRNANGSIATGEMRIKSASTITMVYDTRTNKRLTVAITAGAMHEIEEVKRGRNWKEWNTNAYPLGPLSTLFRRSTNLRTSAVTDTGTQDGLTFVTLIDPKQRVGGYAKVFFAPNGQLMGWQAKDDGGSSTNLFILR